MSGNSIHAFLPMWAEWLASALVVIGAMFALVGSFGLLRLQTFFQRIHGPALGATLGVWSMALASAIYFSVQGGQFFVHALLVAFFTAVTAPIVTIFLMRAALFRQRLDGDDVPPAMSREEPQALKTPTAP